jgi:hypothetical protein
MLHNPTEEPSPRIRGAICKAYREVKDPMNPNEWVTITDHLDSCGAFDLVQKQYLHDIKPAAQYGMHPIRMSCLESTVSGRRKGLREGRRRKRQRSSRLCLRHSAFACGKGRSSILPHFYDDLGHGVVIEKIDILHHAQTSLEGKPLALKRSIQASDGLRSYFAKITDLMHRSLLSWYEDGFVIAKNMVDNAAELETDQGISGLCSCTCFPTVTSFMALNEYESLLSSLSVQDETVIAPLARDMPRDSEDASASARVQ